MKTKLFTTNSCLVMMMTLVLALGVQGTAEAINRLTRNAGDLQTVTAGDEYQIRFSVTLQSPTRTSTHTNYAPTPEDNVDATAVADKRNKTTYYLDDYDPDNDATASGYQSEAQVTYDTAHYYEQESIEITVSGGALKKVGSHDASGTSLMMYESTHNSYSTTSNPHQRLSSSVILTLTAPTTPAVVTIGIVTTSDGPTGHAEPGTSSIPFNFTVYVVGPLNAAGTTAVNATSPLDGVEFVSDQQDPRINGHFTFNGANEPVYYSVEGSGRLYVSPVPDRKTSPTNNLYTSSSAPVYLDTNGGSSKVTAHVAGSRDPATILYLFSGGRLNELPQIEVRSGDGQTGAPLGRLDDYFEVRVTDGRRRPVSGLPVTFATTSPTGAMFIPVPGTKVYVAADLTTIEPIDAKPPTTVEATATHPSAAATHHVQTDRNGVAKIYYQLSSTSVRHIVTATADRVGTTENPLRATLNATASTSARAGIANLEIVSGNNQRAEKGQYLEDDLVVIVRSLAGHRLQDVIIQFRTITGTLVPAEGTFQPEIATGARGRGELPQGSPTVTIGGTAVTPPSGQQIYVKTGANGEAGVTYNVGQTVVAREIEAEVRFEESSAQFDFAIDRVVFNVNGSSSPQNPQPNPNPNPQPQVTTLTVPSSLSGAPGSTQTLRITSPVRPTVGTLTDTFITAGGSATPAGGTAPLYTTTLTLPSVEGPYSLTVSAGLTASEIVTVTVTGATGATAQGGGTLTVTSDFRGAPGSQLPVTIRATDANGDPASGVSVALSVTNGGGTFSPSTVTTGTDGIATSTLIRGSTPGDNYFIRASASNYDTVESRISITGTGQQQQQQQQQRTAGDPVYLDLYDGDDQSGSLNTQLSEPFIVEVLDANEDPVEDVRVRFRVTVGSGTFRPRTPRTDDDGFAEVLFTPTSSGRIVVAASVTGIEDPVAFTVTAGESPETLTKVSGDAQNGTPGSALANPFVVEVQDADGDPVEGVRVTFSVTAGGGSLSETSDLTNRNGRAETTLTLGSQVGINSVEASVPGVDPVTFSTSIEPEIRVAAGSRPVMYWIDNGRLYRLAGAKATKVAERATDVAVGSEKLYWIEQTSETRGAVHHANLDGTNAEVLKTLTSVPQGLTLDAANEKLYLSNGWGKIQRMNVDGTGFQTNFLVDLGTPQSITVSDSRVYWTDGSGRVRHAPLQGQKTIRNIVTGSGALGGIVTDGNKVYWTETTGERSGRIRSANLDGTGAVTDVYTVTATVHGLAIDPANNQLYWTNGWGKVQRGAPSRGDVVTGLMAPTALAIGGANTATTPTPAKPKTPTTVSNPSKYDVNGDGSVDNVDAGLVIGSLGTTTAKYDVDGDGSVTFTDVQLVLNNRDEGAAGAPMLFGMKLTAEQIARIEEQIDLFIATGDRSPAAMRTLIYLQQLIATARPEKTQLLANYPNPFNPETWIPYELATDTEVRLTIYNAQGVVVRTLQLGQQSAGYYTDRERAAYWDGRNALGEQVASGIYFYQLETDEISSLRKMVILK